MNLSLLFPFKNRTVTYFLHEIGGCVLIGCVLIGQTVVELFLQLEAGLYKDLSTTLTDESLDLFRYYMLFFLQRKDDGLLLILM